jgi:hypothetical protein
MLKNRDYWLTFGQQKNAIRKPKLFSSQSVFYLMLRTCLRNSRHGTPQRNSDDFLHFSPGLRGCGQHRRFFPTGPVVRISRQTRFHAAQLAVSSRLDDYLPVARLGWVSVDPDT